MKKRKNGRRYQGKAWINFSGSSLVLFFVKCCNSCIFIFFLKDFLESDLVFWVMEFHNLTPNRENELYRIFNQEYWQYIIVFVEALVL